MRVTFSFMFASIKTSRRFRRPRGGPSKGRILLSSQKYGRAISFNNVVVFLPKVPYRPIDLFCLIEGERKLDRKFERERSKKKWKDPSLAHPRLPPKCVFQSRSFKIYEKKGEREGKKSTQNNYSEWQWKKYKKRPPLAFQKHVCAIPTDIMMM